MVSVCTERKAHNLLPSLLPQLSGAPSAAAPARPSRSGLRGGAGGAETRLELELKREEQRAGTESEKCCPRAEFWINPFQACTANFSAITGAVLAAGAAATRSGGDPLERGEPPGAPHAGNASLP